jgi:hypothetical protein
VYAQRPDFERPEVAAIRVQGPLDEIRLLAPDVVLMVAERGVVSGLDQRSSEYRRADTTLDAYVALKRFEEHRGDPLKCHYVSVEHMAHGVRVRVNASTRRIKDQRGVAGCQVILEETRPVIKVGYQSFGCWLGPQIVWDDRRGGDLPIACGGCADCPANLRRRIYP